MFSIINGNITTINCDYLCHITNSTRSKESGITEAIFTKYKEANTYNRYNKGECLLGECDYFHNASENKYIVNMNAQQYWGKPNIYANDTFNNRKRWLNECLSELLKLIGDDRQILETIVVFPYSCALNWAEKGKSEEYLEILENFSKDNDIIIKVVKEDLV